MVLSKIEINEIIIKYQMSISINKIAKDMNINKNAVHLWIKRLKT